MDEIRVEIIASEELLDPPIDERITESAFFVEEVSYALRVSKISLSGKYNREYTIVAFTIGLDDKRVLLDGDLLIVCLWSNILIIDLKSNELVRNVELDSCELFEICKFKSGYLIHGEDAIRFMNADFEIAWDEWACDIYANKLVEKEFEVFADYATAYDWYGNKHYFDENGEFKIEPHPEYSND